MTVVDYQAARAALVWQLEMGVDEAILDEPQDRYAEDIQKPKLKFGKNSNLAPISAAKPVFEVKESATDIATILAGRCEDLTALHEALGLFEHCALKKGARNLVFSDGNPEADVMVIGEAPGRDEDREGLPFVGRAGQLLDKMFAAIDLSRSEGTLYITNVIPWRPPQNRDPSQDEIQMMLPFLRRHVELAAPKLIVLMGNTACNAVLGKTGITRMRGSWTEGLGVPVMPMFHPAALLRDTLKKRDAWADLLAIKARLRG